MDMFSDLKGLQMKFGDVCLHVSTGEFHNYKKGGALVLFWNSSDFFHGQCE